MNKLFYRKIIGTFAGYVEYTMLMEGLISTYDIKQVQKNLNATFGDKIEINNPSPTEFSNNNFEWHTYTFYINLLNFDAKIKSKIIKILDVYGYYISKIKTEGVETGLTIEPKYPIIINDILKKENVYYLYHISHKSNLESIKKIGLAPRGTETTFYHPDDRIYLLMANIQQVRIFRNLLANDKKQKKEDFIIFKIRNCLR